MKISKVLLFGDSVFFGYGASARALGCGKLLKQRMTKPVVIRAKNNDTTADALRRVRSLEEDAMAHVLVMFGNNDSRLVALNTPAVSLEQYKRNIRSIISFIRSIRGIPLLCNLQPIDNDGFFSTLPEMAKLIDMDSTPYTWHKRYSDACGEVSAEENIDLVDIRTGLERRKTEVMYSDGLHPNDLGHRIIADTIHRKLAAIGFEDEQS